MRSLLLFFFSLALWSSSIAQSYQVNVAGYSGSAFYNPYLYTISGSFGLIQNSTGSFIVSSLPTSFNIEFRNASNTSCILSGTVTSSSMYCASGSGGGPTASCGGGGVTASIAFSARPILTFLTGTSLSNDYCSDESITLNASTGYSSYNWQYRIGASGTWQIFNPGSGLSVTFGISDIFGSSYPDHYNEEVYFRYSIPCETGVYNSGAQGPFTFGPIRPTVASATVTIPTCKDFTDATIFITSINRDIILGEELTYTVYTLGDEFVAQKSSSVQPSVSTPVEIRGDNSVEAPFGIAAANYKILVGSTASLCGSVQYYQFLIDEPDPVTFSSTSTQPLCVGGSTGSITVTATGGSGTGYTYSKDGGTTYQGSNVLSGLTAGSYTVKVKDSKGCESAPTPAIILTNPAALTISGAVTSDYNGSDISCATSTNGQITAAGSGGTGTLTYSRNGPTFQASNIFNSLGAGNYTITVKDGNGCTKQSSVVPVVAPPAITGTLSVTDATCHGTATGSLTVLNPSGGTGTLQYSKDGSTYQGSTTFSGLAATNYTITIRDANLCITTLNGSVSQPSAITVTGIPTVVTCAGGSDGQVTINASNGVGTIQYAFNGGSFQTSNIFTGVSAGSYTLSVRDDNSCIGNGNVTVTSNPAITASITTSTAISCNGGNNGALNLTPSGGVGPYTYVWSTGASTEDINGLSATSYSVTITDTKSCQKSFAHTLTQPPAITISETLSDYNGENVSCFGSTNGTISLTPAGGNGGYTYLWSTGTTTKDINTLAAGTYTITVTDSKSCTGSKSITLTQPDELQSTLSNTQNILCFGGNTGSITIATTGGTTVYQYSINNGSSWQSNTTFNNLAANSYTILTRDVNGCTDTNSTTLTSPSKLVLSVSNVTNTTCNQNNGSATATATGGAGNYSYSWLDNGNQTIGTTGTISNLSAGIYTIQTSDENNCSKEQTVTISSSNGPAIAITSTTAASCSYTSDGSATINITQGQTPYTITWPDNQSTTTATSLSGGDYVVEVRDGSGCLVLKTVTVPSPAPLAIETITQQAPNCAGNADGTIAVMAAGGNGGYNYQWSTGSTSSTLSNVAAGAYTLTIKDVKNCEIQETITLIDPEIFIIDVGGDEKICAGQVITKQVNESDGTYAWSGPEEFTSTAQQVSITQPGTYSIEVTNSKGCKATDAFEVAIDPNLLKADFLLVSEAHVGDTVVAIDISWPVPGTLVWDVAPGTVIDQTVDYMMVRYDAVGEYVINIEAHLAQCVSRYSQTIMIMEAPADNSGGRTPSALIRKVNVYPNPAAEQVTVEITLSQAEQVLLEVYHLQSNERVLARGMKEKAEYSEQLPLANLKAGLYVISIKAGDETRTVKLIKL